MGSPDGDEVPDLALILTAIILLLRPPEIWWLTVISAVGAGLTLLFARIRRAPATWYVLAAIVGARIVSTWPLADNHIYLLVYWCLAIALALGGARPADTLRSSSRWLLAGVFVLAVLWKGVLSSDYTDGRFFRVTLLTDDRFADAAMAIGGLTRDELLGNRAAIDALPEGAELMDPPAIIEPPAMRIFATVATWGGLALEFAIAVFCVWPGERLELARHVAILSFCAITYAMAPVAGFGWLLATMGLAQSRSDQRALRIAYVAVFFIVLAFSELPRTAFARTL